MLSILKLLEFIYKDEAVTDNDKEKLELIKQIQQSVRLLVQVNNLSAAEKARIAKEALEILENDKGGLEVV